MITPSPLPFTGLGGASFISPVVPSRGHKINLRGREMIHKFIFFDFCKILDNSTYLSFEQVFI